MTVDTAGVDPHVRDASRRRNLAGGLCVCRRVLRRLASVVCNLLWFVSEFVVTKFERFFAG